MKPKANTKLYDTHTKDKPSRIITLTCNYAIYRKDKNTITRSVYSFDFKGANTRRGKKGFDGSKQLQAN